MVKRNIDINAPLTEEQKAMLDRSASMPIVFDEDCPELTEAELLEFKRVADVRRENRLYIEKADKRLMEMGLMPSELSDTLKLDVKMKNRIVFENEDLIIETIEHNHDYIATITNKTAKDLQLGIAEFGLEANWDIEPGGWVGIKADEMGYEILDALEAGNFEYME